MAWNNLLNFLAGGTRERERRETEALYDRIRGAFARSAYTDDKFGEFRVSIILEVCERAERIPIDPLINAIGQLVGGLVDYDFLLYGLPDRPNFDALTAHEGVDLRTYLKRKERFLADPEHLAFEWRSAVVSAIAGILGYLPATLFKEDWDDPDPPPEDGPTVPLVDLVENPALVMSRLLATFTSDLVLKADLFNELREQFDRRICAASGIEWHERFETKRKPVSPEAYKPQQPSLLATAYLDGTPWKIFFDTPLPLTIPFPVRFEHTHIVGGSGHGKTQLLQLSILRDLEASIEDGRSIVVIDSQGDLIQNVSGLSLFAPDDPSGLSDRLLIVDPTDVEYPVALNMFDFDRGTVERLPLVERERVLNATIDLYEYFFGALLGAELTARQGIIFKYIARLLLEVPDATIHTFRELMEDGEPFRQYMEKLPPTSRAFFETRFFDRSFSETKKQVLTRLWGVLSNATFDRMFSHPRSKVDIHGALQGGKIVLVNTAKDLLGHEGASILGRFFIALIAQAAQRRAIIPQHERNPAFVYIDEAADYFDENIDHLLNQARKYKVGMVLAHQNLDQLSQSLRASIFASTSIKYAGGVSSRDATVFAGEMRSEREFLESMRKRQRETKFACYVRNVTARALGVSVPLGVLEGEPTMSDAEWQVVHAANRAAYCIPLADVPEAQFRPRQKAEARAGREAPREAAPAPLSAEPQPTVAGAVSPQGEEPAPPRRETAAPEAKQHPTGKKPVPPRKAKAMAGAAPPLGRGGKEHKYLQNLIKEFAISKGYHAVIEEEILDGTGRVDVSLALQGKRIGCEISVTTGRDHEFGNIEKCLAAGYEHVLFVSSDPRHVRAMEKLAESHFEDEERGKLHFQSPDGALELIGGWAGGTTVSTVRGYKVQTTTKTVNQEEAGQRRNAVAAVIARSIRPKTK